MKHLSIIIITILIIVSYTFSHCSGKGVEGLKEEATIVMIAKVEAKQRVKNPKPQYPDKRDSLVSMYLITPQKRLKGRSRDSIFISFIPEDVGVGRKVKHNNYYWAAIGYSEDPEVEVGDSTILYFMRHEFLKDGELYIYLGCDPISNLAIVKEELKEYGHRVVPYTEEMRKQHPMYNEIKAFQHQQDSLDSLEQKLIGELKKLNQ